MSTINPIDAAAMLTNQDFITRYNNMLAKAFSICQGTNGDGVYSAIKSQMGHIEADKFLLIPESFHNSVLNAPTMNVDLNYFGTIAGADDYDETRGKDHATEIPYMNCGDVANDEADFHLAAWKIIIMNFDTLVNSGISAQNAYAAAVYRMRWCSTGAYKALIEDDTETLIEHRIIDAADPDYGAIASAPDIQTLAIVANDIMVEIDRIATSDPALMEFVIMSAENVFSAVEATFRTKGHHFKNTGPDKKEYIEWYTRYLTSAFQGNVVWPDSLDMFTVFHTAIHPFRIRSLAITVAHYMSHRKLAQSSLVRVVSSPCGSAIFTTTDATLSAMKAEPWWPAFYKAFEEDIELVKDFALQIRDNRYAFHQGAKLYGVDKLNYFMHKDKRMSVNIAKARIAYIAAAAQGMIAALAYLVKEKAIEGFALANAKCLTKCAMNAPMLCNNIRTLIIATMNIQADNNNLKSLIEHAIPDMTKLYDEAIKEGAEDSKRKKSTDIVTRA